ncbi:MAG TPA: phosphate ABC transporter substrate-binding protein [Dehalococcoidia bacterium]|nr:phosphate ABC transporter substrate-binding protein [Dehalococcoidia bacterium]
MSLIKTKAGYLVMLICILLLTLTPLLAGCDNGDEDGEPTATPVTSFELSGTIDEAGSTSVQPLAELMAADFMKIHPKVKINISGGGSSSGVKACAAGTVDIGAASRDIKITEPDLIPHCIARDAVAIAVHPSNPVSELTVDQVAAIYEGTINNWSEVGGNNENIVVVSREEGSGTRDCFESKVTKDIKDDALFYDSNGAVKTKVSSESKAIGFLSLGYVEGLKAITLDGVDPTPESCASGDYPVLRRLYLLTIEVPTGAIKAFLEFCRSEEGQAIAASEGYIALNK